MYKTEPDGKRPALTYEELFSDDSVPPRHESESVHSAKPDRTKKDKFVEVSQNELTRYIYQHCPDYFYNTHDGECCRRKVTAETCSLHVFAGELNCPLDCPRLNTKEYGCDKGRCPVVRATIRNLKEPCGRP